MPKKRKPQVVFRMGDAGIAAGAPPELAGAFFLCEPGRDRGLANDYLYALHTREFQRLKRDDAPSWMSRGAFRMRPSSLRTEAGNLSRGFRLLEQMGLSVLTMTEDHLDEIASRLEKQNLKPGSVGAIQRSLLHCAQYAVWKGRRPKLDISWSPAGGNTTTNIHVLRKQQRNSVVPYIDTETFDTICAAIDQRVYRIALRLMRGSGLRPSEPARIDDSSMPHQPGRSRLSPDTFAVIGKGEKRRRPEVDAELIREIEQYRLHDRPTSAAKYQRRKGRPPTHLLLNAKNGDPITYHSLYGAFRKACEKAGIVDTKMHWARHAFACDRVAATVLEQIGAARSAGITVAHADIEPLIDAARMEVMLLLGHAHLSTSEIYLTQIRRAIAHALKTAGRH